MKNYNLLLNWYLKLVTRFWLPNELVSKLDFN